MKNRHYVRKSKIVSAEKFCPMTKPWPEGVEHADQKKWNVSWVVWTGAEHMAIEPGYWIITNAWGKRRPYTPDAFERDYTEDLYSTDGAEY